MVMIGRDEVTEKAISVLESVRSSYAAVAVYDDEGRVRWNSSVSGTRYRDDPQRITHQGNVDLQLFDAFGGAVFGRLGNWSFRQDERSTLYFGPEWYNEFELLAGVRTSDPETDWFVEGRAGVQWGAGERNYGFDAGGDFGFVGDLRIEKRSPGRFRCGLRLFMESLETDQAFTGYGAEGWLQLWF